MRLYHVSTIAKEYDGCRDVAFDWFRCERGEPRPYAELIENYDPGDDMGYAEGTIDEMFTEAEAVALKAYLDREHGDAGVTTIREMKLPICNNTMGESEPSPSAAGMASTGSTRSRHIACRFECRVISTLWAAT